MEALGVKNRKRLDVFINIFVPFFLFIVGWLYYSSEYISYITSVDEGALCAVTSRLLLGQTIYKDFNMTYTPGIYYLYMWLYKLTNIDILVLDRLLDNLLNSLSSVLIYLIAKRLVPVTLSIFLGLQLIFITGVGYPYSVAFSQNFSIFFCLLSLLMTYKFYETNRYLYIFSAGAHAALSILFFQATGISIIIAIVLYILLQHAAGRKFYFKTYTYFGSGLGTIIIPVILYFCLNSALYDLLEDAIFLAMMRYNAAMKIFPSFFETLASNKIQYSITWYLLFLREKQLFLPIVICIYSIGYIAYRLLTRRFIKHNNYFLLLFIFNLFNLPYFCGEFIGSHWNVIIPTVHIIGIYFLVLGSRYIIKDTLGKYVKNVLVLFILMPLAIYYIYPLKINEGKYEKNIFNGIKHIVQYMGRHFKETPSNRILAGIKEMQWAEYAVSEYIKDNTHPKDKIFIFGDSAVIYYLSNRLGETEAPYILPGAFLNYGEEEAIGTLNHSPVKYIIIRPSWFTGMAMSEYPGMYNYIKKHYFKIKEISGYEIYTPLSGTGKDLVITNNGFAEKYDKNLQRKLKQNISYLLDNSLPIDKRWEAEETIVKMGKSSIPLLLKILEKDKEKKAINLIIMALEEIGSNTAIPALGKILLKNKDMDLQITAALALGKFQDETSVDYLIKRLNSNNILRSKASIIRYEAQDFINSSILKSNIPLAEDIRDGWYDVGNWLETRKGDVYLEFSFTGTACDIIAYHDVHGALWDISIDGGKAFNYNQYSKVTQKQSRTNLCRDLPYGKHVIKMHQIGGNYARLEAFEVYLSGMLSNLNVESASEDKYAQGAVIVSLGRLGYKKSIPILKDKLKNGIFYIRGLAEWALDNIKKNGK